MSAYGVVGLILATLAIASTMGISKYSVSITSSESSSNGVVSSVVVSSAVVSTKDYGVNVMILK
jgi:hypothetical protein